MKINCDVGESFGIWALGCDADLMPYLDMANIACGMHASDPVTMARTISLARSNGVQIGAHPGYPDLVGFGRREMAMDANELRQCLLYQIGALQGLCRAQGCQVEFIKPHGALYNKMMRDPETLALILDAVAAYDSGMPLVVQAASPEANEQLRSHARTAGVTLWFEAFADRAYGDDALLIPRQMPGAVHAAVDDVIAQAQFLIADGKVRCLSGTVLDIEADTLCFHGDAPSTRDALSALRRAH